MQLTWITRLSRRPLAACVAIVLPLVLAEGGALAAETTSGGGPALVPAASAHPHLTTNTNAGCNTPPPRGLVRCFAIVRTRADHVLTADSSGPPPGALGPADIQSAYMLPSATAGGGQTVAIVDAYGDSHAESDLATFRAHYGLPACTTANGCFTKVDQAGGSSYPPDDSGWGEETSLDLDAVSAACPKCNILLVEASTPTITDLEAAVNEAVTLGARYISNSYGTSEFSKETSFDSAFNHPGVAVTASAGDDGYGTNWPSASPYVTAVGGTTLTKDSGVPRGWDETVWDHSGYGTGSGCSAYEQQPSFQQDITQLDAVCKKRATADVAADADPSSGLAVYDTLGVGGWLKVGGTSLSSPLIAASYALAGAPAAGTYPDAYPYHDPNQSSDLFDITQGSNGNCGDVLCQAGPGWDGPTGLGSPDGVKAFTGAPQGHISGQVTNSATGKPVAGATVTAQPGDYVTRTDASGNYSLTLAEGTYTLTAVDYGYQTQSQSGVKVTANQTLTDSFALTPVPSGTLTGTVTDGSGHGWPLHAQITIPGYPAGSVWTSPYTGAYRVRLAQGSYTLAVSTDYPGYQARQIQVTVGPGTTTQNVTLDADLAACTAPGYGWHGLTEDFTGWTGATSRDGWTITSKGPATWRFDNPASRPPPMQLQPSTSSMPVAGGDDDFAIADSGYYAPHQMDSTLTSPPANLTGQSAPELQFDTAYYAASTGSSTATVQLSVNGGRPWSTVWRQGPSNAIGHVTIPLRAAAGKPDVRVRFTYIGHRGWYWAIDNVFAGTRTCVPQHGGLLAGAVTAKTTGQPVNGATVTTARAPGLMPWPEGISLASGDPALPRGFYWLFAPAGRQRATAAAPGYATAATTVHVAAGQVTRQDWALSAAGGSRS